MNKAIKRKEDVWFLTEKDISHLDNDRNPINTRHRKHMNKANAISAKHWNKVKKEQRLHMKNLKDYYGQLVKCCLPCDKRYTCELLNCARECKDEGFTQGAISNLMNCEDVRARMLGKHGIKKGRLKNVRQQSPPTG